MNPQELASILSHCLLHSLENESEDFRWDKFFILWFRERGNPYYFLFNQHLGVTNAQYAELYSLIESHAATEQGAARNVGLLFQRTERMKAAVADAMNMLLDYSPEQRPAAALAFAERYIDVFRYSVAIDMFYCSCAIFLPPGLDIDIQKITAESGYIHSAGRSVFVRNIRKAKQQHLRLALNLHLGKSQPKDLPLPFVVYSHEDFTGSDEDAKEEIYRGIDAVKLHVEKMAMGSVPLAQVVNEIRTEYVGRLEVPPPGVYHEMHDFRGLTNRAIWLVCDRSINDSNPTSAGGRRYYICYEQQFMSISPFFLFDENKPAWKSHTTLPHSLTAALINCTKPHVPGSKIVDPFGGTGTTWLEGKRIGVSASLRCSDISPICPLMLNDNIRFFLMSSVELLQLSDELERMEPEIRQLDARGAGAPNQNDLDFSMEQTPYVTARAIVEGLRKENPSEEQEFSFSPAVVKALSDLTYIKRFTFYIVLRAELRNRGAFHRKSKSRERLFLKSLAELQKQIRKFIELRRSVTGDEVRRDSISVVFRGKYSEQLFPLFFLKSLDELAADAKLSVTGNHDARQIEPNSVDAIICDPPYGFNTREEQGELADLYAEFIGVAIAALRHGGHFIICLPSESYTGRDLPYCTGAGLITNQVLIKAKAVNKRIYTPARSLPSQLLAPPYYWEAERALRRTILHFRIEHLGPPLS
jgi:hypothetical protein